MSRALVYSIERKRLEFQIRYIANHDQLTGLANRSLFRERLQLAIIRYERNDEIITVLYLDLDHFKAVNDGVGHEIGGQLLFSVAERLSEAVRKSDTVGRLGGDEFAIVLDSIKINRCAAVVANKIIIALADPFELSGHTIYTESSIGIVVYSHSGDNVEDLLKNSDSAMYSAKKSGRGQ